MQKSEQNHVLSIKGINEFFCESGSTLTPKKKPFKHHCLGECNHINSQHFHLGITEISSLTFDEAYQLNTSHVYLKKHKHMHIR